MFWLEGPSFLGCQISIGTFKSNLEPNPKSQVIYYMEAEIQQLYSSSICSVRNFLCRCQSCSTSSKEHEEQFVVAYIRKGNFQLTHSEMSLTRIMACFCSTSLIMNTR